MILDIIMIAIVALFLFIGLRRGIAKTLYGLASIVLSGILAYFSGRFFANLLYKNLIYKSISEGVTNAVSNTAHSSESVAQGVLDGIPDFFSGILSMFGISGKTLSTSIDVKSSSEAITSSINSVVAPIIVSVFSALFIIVLFLIFLLLFKLLGRHILRLFELPVIRWINAFLGGVFGLGEGIVLVFAAIIVLRMVLPLCEHPFITNDMINSSYLFKTIYNSGFASLITNVVN